MANLNAEGIEIRINFYDLDSCGDILYSYEFFYDQKNIFNPNILNENFQNGKFTTTECHFEISGVLMFFKRIISNLEMDYYESLEPPYISIKCNAWKEKRDYIMHKWKNSYHDNGVKKFSNESIDSMEENWKKDIELVFSINQDFLSNQEKYANISIAIQTNTDLLQAFVIDFENEFIEFKKKFQDKHKNRFNNY